MLRSGTLDPPGTRTAPGHGAAGVGLAAVPTQSVLSQKLTRQIPNVTRSEEVGDVPSLPRQPDFYSTRLAVSVPQPVKINSSAGLKTSREYVLVNSPASLLSSMFRDRKST